MPGRTASELAEPVPHARWMQWWTDCPECYFVSSTNDELLKWYRERKMAGIHVPPARQPPAATGLLLPFQLPLPPAKHAQHGLCLVANSVLVMTNYATL